MSRAYGLPLCSAGIFVLSCVVASVDAVQIGRATPCDQASVDTAGWQEIDAGPFLIKLPAGIDGYPARVVMGFDSAGAWGRRGPPKFVVAAAWRTIGALTLTATGDKSEIPALFAIIRSVVFKIR